MLQDPAQRGSVFPSEVSRLKLEEMGPLLPRGLSYRKIDYWLRTQPDLFSDDVRGHGSGRYRDFTWGDVRTLLALHYLTEAGLTLAAAVCVAETHQPEVALSSRVTLRLRLPQLAQLMPDSEISSQLSSL